VGWFFLKLCQSFRNNEEHRHYYYYYVPFKKEKSSWFLNFVFWIQTVSWWTAKLESRRKKKKSNSEVKISQSKRHIYLKRNP